MRRGLGDDVAVCSLLESPFLDLDFDLDVVGIATPFFFGFAVPLLPPPRPLDDPPPRDVAPLAPPRFDDEDAPPV